MEPMKKTVVLAVVAALAGCGGSAEETAVTETTSERVAASAVAVDSGVLRLTFGPQNNDFRIVVGPDAGVVQVIDQLRPGGHATYRDVRAIEYRAGAGDDKIALAVNQSADFDVLLDTGTSNADIDVQWVVPASSTGSSALTPSLTLLSGPGQKKVQLALESFAPAVAFGLKTAMGAGDTEFKGNLQFKAGSVQSGVAADLTFGTAVLNKAELIVESAARSTDVAVSSVSINEFVSKIVSDQPSDRMRVSFRPVAPTAVNKTTLELTTAATDVGLDLGMTGGAGAEDVSFLVDSKAAARIAAGINTALGQGNDRLTARISAVDGSSITLAGRAVLGGGDDEAKLEVPANTGVSLSLNCGDGIDKASGFPVRSACELN
jgi:hypothetical protein